MKDNNKDSLPYLLGGNSSLFGTYSSLKIEGMEMFKDNDIVKSFIDLHREAGAEIIENENTLTITYYHSNN